MSSLAADAAAAVSSSNSALSSMVSDPGLLIMTTQGEFNIFHNIDRRLFCRLVMNLGRDPFQSTRVMAVFMWLEKTSKNCRMMFNLMTWPDHLLNDLANEAVIAFTCIESEEFPFPDAMNEMPSIQKLTHSGINLKFIHENRHSIMPVVAKSQRDICTRAFNDIIKKVQLERAVMEKASLEKMKMIQEQNLNHPPPFPAPGLHFFRMGPPLPMGYYNLGFPMPVVRARVAIAGVVPPHHVVGMTGQLTGTQSQVNRAACNWCGIQKFDIAQHRGFLNNKSNQLLGAMHLNVGDNNATEASEVHPDDRTIFVTFSKGYPISESEVLDFFTRRYGDIFEAVHMQEVAPLEQPLYARLVVRQAAVHMIQVVLEGSKKIKFNINGKHVWARKFVPKNLNKSPQIGSPGTSQPDSPATYNGEELSSI